MSLEIVRCQPQTDSGITKMANLKFDNLDQIDKFELTSIANKKFESNINYILSEAERFKKSGENSKLIEISDDELLVFNNSNNPRTNIHIGFPFPLTSSKYDKKIDNISMDFFLRGETIRNRQRKLLEKVLDSNIERINDVQEFRNIVSLIYNLNRKSY
jgi:hypothetical protein